MKKQSSKKTILQFFGIITLAVSMILTANASAVRSTPVSTASNGQLLGGFWQQTFPIPATIPYFATLSDMTPDGEIIVFTTTLAVENFVPGIRDNGDINANSDVIVRNVRTGEMICASCQVLQGVLVSWTGSTPRISANGRYVVYSGINFNGQTNINQVFRVDLQTGGVEIVSVGPTPGSVGNFSSTSPVISDDGRYVAFLSVANNLVAGYPTSPTGEQLFVRDMQSGQTFLASHAALSVSQPGNAPVSTSHPISMSGDGRLVAWTTTASNYFLAFDNNGVNDVYFFDVLTPAATVGVASSNAIGSSTGNGASFGGIISSGSDSNSVSIVFASNATNLNAADPNPGTDIYRFKIGLPTSLVSVASDGSAANAPSGNYSTISRNGRFVAFSSKASNLVSGVSEPNTTNDVFLRDLQTNTTRYVSLNAANLPSNTADGATIQTPVFAERSNLFLNRNISDDGRFVAFTSNEPMSVRDNANTPDIYVRDMSASVSILASLNRSGNGGQNFGFGTGGVQSTGSSDFALSADGRKVAFATFATNLVAGDTTSVQNSKVFQSRISLLSQRSASDVNGDGKNDFTVFRPSEANWYALFNGGAGEFSQVFFGENGDRIAPGDYDGDSKTDYAVFVPASGRWEILQSKDNSIVTKFFGTATDVIAPADFDGDGRTDLAFYRPSTGTWFIMQSNTNSLRSVKFGLSNDVPVVGDYDGDNRADIAIFRPSTGVWWLLLSTSGGIAGFNWGISTDKPVTGDFDGDGRSDAAVFRAGLWYILKSRDGSSSVINWGLSNDRLVPSDYDGDGKTDLAVFRPTEGRWYVLPSTTQTMQIADWGLSGDIPVPSAYIP
jgi:hypothetical protein